MFTPFGLDVTAQARIAPTAVKIKPTPNPIEVSLLGRCSPGSHGGVSGNACLHRVYEPRWALQYASRELDDWTTGRYAVAATIASARSRATFSMRCATAARAA